MKFIKEHFKMLMIGSFCVIFIVFLYISAFISAKLQVKINNETIEYGEDIHDRVLFEDAKTGEPLAYSLDIRTDIVGKYKEEVTLKNGNHQTFTITVKDSKSPIITLNQTDKAEIPIHSKIDLRNNIKEVIDKVDGKIDTIEIIEKEAYDKILFTTEEKCKQLNDRVFTSLKDIENIDTKTDEYTNAVILSSNIDVTQPGEYEVYVSAIDKNYNITSLSYAIQVVEDIDSISNESVIVQKDDASSDNSVLNDTQHIPSSDSVAMSALNLVGSAMSCDELVTAALINGGRIENGSSKYFDNVIGMVYYPQLGTQISASQALPGDVLYYSDGGAGSAHVAIYLGDGKAVHGGWNGLNVVVDSANIGSGPIYLRMPGYLTWNQIDQIIYGESQSTPYDPSAPENNTNVIPPQDDYYVPDISDNDISWPDQIPVNAIIKFTINGETFSFTSNTGDNAETLQAYSFDYMMGVITKEEFISKAAAIHWSLT